MQTGIHLGILSDIHYAGAAERRRTNYLNEGITNPALRLLINLYRRHIWLRDPFAHNHLLDRFIDQTRGMDLVVANGDYSCDSAYIGVSDDAACASAAECLGKLRQNFPGKFHATFGDHEIGKRMMGGSQGGLRLASFHRARSELELQPVWSIEVGRYVLLGVVSTLLAYPVYASESLVAEQPEWHELRKQHLEQVREAFQSVKAHQKILLFCHDPTALPFLGHEQAVQEKLGQIEKTVLGHLHSNFILFKSRLLAGMPSISFLGHTPRRLSMALRMARQWRPFNVLLCPSLAGLELLKDGGFYTVELAPGAAKPARFELHRFGRKLIRNAS
jgi:hypothetical protein